MIKPASLWSIMKTCDNSKWIGDVCRALGGQDVELDYGQRQMVASIKMDSGWMDERVEAQRERWRSQKRNQRGVFVSDDGTERADIADMSTVRECPPPSVPPSVPPSIHPSNNNIIIEEKEEEREVTAPLPLSQMIPAAELCGIPRYYTEWWFERQRGVWKMSNDKPITKENWRGVIKAWFSRASELELAKLENKFKEEQAEVAKKSKEWSSSDWILCYERCEHCNGCGCSNGIKVPPQHQEWPITPEECVQFKAKQGG